MKSSLRLGRVFGIEIGLDYSWFIVFALVTWSLAGHVFPMAYPAWPRGLMWGIGVLTSLLFFASVLAHGTAAAGLSALAPPPRDE